MVQLQKLNKTLKLNKIEKRKLSLCEKLSYKRRNRRETQKLNFNVARIQR